jgi:hypothetical protein
MIRKSLYTGWLWGAGLSVAAIAATGATASGAELLILSANSGDTMVFDKTLGPDGEWSIPGSQVNDGTTITTDFLTEYHINPSTLGVAVPTDGTLSWTGNGLDQDLNPGGPLAAGTFFGGGIFTLIGQVYTRPSGDGNPPVLSPFTPVPTVLLTGPVFGFGVEEDVILDNAMDATDPGALFVPTGGVLHDGTILDSGNFYIKFTITEAQQGGGNLDDFQSSIFSTESFQFVLGATTDVPEPGSLVLLLGSALLAGARRTKRGQ